MKKKISTKDIRLKIMNALSRREHSEKEIYLKFINLVDSKNNLLEEIVKLKEEGLISNQRYAEAYIRSRFHSGFGPVRIKYELGKKGVIETMIIKAFQETDLDWDDKLKSEFKKKYESNEVKNLNINKISKFFLYRGFDLEKISKLIKSN
ncbi:MAG: regulatory protein RecX [Gammaproteobacteria bacterium]